MEGQDSAFDFGKCYFKYSSLIYLTLNADVSTKQLDLILSDKQTYASGIRIPMKGFIDTKQLAAMAG